MLWEARLNDVSISSPITYSVNGRQYLAIVVGQGGFQAASYAPLVPELRSPPDRGAAIGVFALPDRNLPRSPGSGRDESASLHRAAGTRSSTRLDIST